MHISLFLIIIIGLEVNFRSIQNSEDKFTVKKVNGLEPSYEPDKEKVITVQEFHKRVLNGEKLVILDDMVLDVQRFMSEHPGG